MRNRKYLTRVIRIRKILFLVGVFVLISPVNPSVFATDTIGPPAASLEHGQFSIGADFTYSDMDLELNDGIWIEYLDSVFDAWGEATDFTLKDFKVNKGHINLGYGISDNVEAWFRLGVSNAKFGDSIWEDSERFKSHAEPALGVGIKMTFIEQDAIKLGGSLQLDWAEYDGQLYAKHWASSDFVEVDITEAKIAAGVTYMLTNSVSIYGGPFLHFVSGDIYDVFSEVDSGTGGLLTSEYMWDIQEDSVFGAYLGAQVELIERYSVNFEYQHTASADAFGASLVLRF